MEQSLTDDAQRFLQLATRLRRLGDRSPAQEIAVTPSHFALLEAIAEMPGSNLQHIADALRLSPPTVSIAIRQMESTGWVERRPHPQDRRAFQCYLTAEGQKVYQQAVATHRRKFERLLQGLTPSERNTLLTLLERTLQAAEAPSASDHQSSPRKNP